MRSALDMTRYWRQLDDEVALTPMPPEYQNMMVQVRGLDPATKRSTSSELKHLPLRALVTALP